MAIILASSSRYRVDLLSRLGVEFTTCSPNIDETPRASEPPRALSARLSGAKAQAIAATTANATLVIGSDQVADINGRPLGKPGTRERAKAQLRAASGQTVTFHTAVTLVNTTHDAAETLIDQTLVRFRILNDDAIDRYLNHETPLDCAGSFKAEGLGICLFESIQSQDPTALVGLPLIALSELLRRQGINLP